MAELEATNLGKEKSQWEEIHASVIAWFQKNKFKTYGDALGCWGTIDRVALCGDRLKDQSRFEIDVLWLTSQNGPKAEVNGLPTKRQRKADIQNYEDEEVEVPEITFKPSKPKKRRKKRRR